MKLLLLHPQLVWPVLLVRERRQSWGGSAVGTERCFVAAEEGGEELKSMVWCPHGVGERQVRP